MTLVASNLKFQKAPFHFHMFSDFFFSIMLSQML